MIREAKMVPVVRYVLSSEEARLVEYCLNYAYHRKTVHNSKGVSGLDLDKLNTLRKSFK